MNQDTPVIEVRDFTMRFGATRVVDRLSFEVRPGETFGLLGANGSGKTTTIRALLGIYTPTAGELLVHGRPFDPAGDYSLGYLPEERGLYRKERVLDVMTYFGRLRGLRQHSPIRLARPVRMSCPGRRPQTAALCRPRPPPR